MPSSPSTWVALLRAVNLGPRRRVPMADLRELLGGLGGTDVRTHLQSGNAVFAMPGRKLQVRSTVEKALGERYGFEVPVALRSAAEIAAVVETAPWSTGDDAEGRRQFVAFLVEPAPAAAVKALAGRRTAEESVYPTRTEVYASIPRTATTPAYGDLEKVLGVATTARTWSVVTRLAELASG